MELSPWSHVKQLEDHAKCIVDSLYGINFPIEARELMDEWIQTSLRKHETADLFTHPVEVVLGERIGSFIQMFLETFKTKIKSLPKACRGSMTAVLRVLEKRHKENPLAIFKFLRHCIYVEQLLVGNPVNSQYYDPNWADVITFVEQFNILAKKTESSKELIGRLNGTMDNTMTLCGELVRCNAALDTLLRRSAVPFDRRNELETNIRGKVGQIQQELANRAQVLSHYRTVFVQGIRVNIDQLAYLQDGVLRKLNYWKSQQERGLNVSFNEGLDTLQLWCGQLVELILACRHQLRSAQTFENNILRLGISVPADTYLQDLREKLRVLLSTLVKLSFIVEIQPPEVVKTQNKIVARLRALMGGTKHLLTAPDDVIVSVVSEEVAIGIEREDASYLARTNGEVSYYSTHVLYCDRRRQSVAEFRSLCVDNVQRRDDEEVCKQKYCIKFQTTFVVDEERFEVCTLSLPVIVIVHGDLEMKSWGPIIWDDIFRSSTGHPFQVKESTSWDSLAQALNRFFAKETGRHLTPDNLQFLREKFLTSHPQENPQNGFSVKYNTFFQDPVSISVNQDPEFVFAKQNPVSTFANGNLEPQEFSFWDWFYTVMKLTKGYLCDHWRKGLIEGFISKQRAAELLRGRPDNTFLLRFTESLKRGPSKIAKLWIGSVSVTWVETHTTDYQRLQSLQPFTATDLESGSLSEIISTCKIAKFLYPDIHSNSVFQAQGSDSRIGYVPLLVTVDAQRKNSRESETQTEHDLVTIVPRTDLLDFSLPPMLSEFVRGVEPMAAESIAFPSFDSAFLPLRDILLNDFNHMELSGSPDDLYNEISFQNPVFGCIANGNSADNIE